VAPQGSKGPKKAPAAPAEPSPEFELLGTETLQSWRAEADSLRVALDRSLVHEAETGEVSFPLLEKDPVAMQGVKDAARAYRLPAYVHRPGSPPPPDSADTLGSAFVAAAQAARRPDDGTQGLPPAAAITLRSPAVPASPRPLAAGGPGAGPTTPRGASREGRGHHVASPTPSTSSSRGGSRPGSAASSASGSRAPPSLRSTEGPLASPRSVGSPTATASAASGRRRKRNEALARPNSRARLEGYLAALTEAHVLSAEDANHFFAPFPNLPVSAEMERRMGEVLERHLGAGPWQDVVASTLARPLDPAVVYADQAAIMELSTVAPALVSEGEQPALAAQTSVTEEVAVVDLVPRAEYLRRLAEQHVAEGRPEEALGCLKEASALLERRTVLVRPAGGGLFPYTHEAFRAARTIQRMLRRRLARRHLAATRAQACFRGYLVRRVALLLAAKRQVAATVIQRRARVRQKRLKKCATQLQRVGQSVSQPSRRAPHTSIYFSPNGASTAQRT
jgi:hypothetical protein